MTPLYDQDAERWSLRERDRQIRQLQDIARLADDGAQASRTRRREMLLQRLQDAQASISADEQRLERLWVDITIAAMELDFVGQEPSR